MQILNNPRFYVFAVLAWIAAFAVPGYGQRAQAPRSTGGTITGKVKLSGKNPGNKIVRMGMDPMCARIYAGKRPGPIDEAIMTSEDGGLANAFVSLKGSFPETPMPQEPVVVEQKGCFYVPRVVGARVGQILRIRNNDNLLHNVHAQSLGQNTFNVGQPAAGMNYDFRLKTAEMLKLTCDVHRWMVSYVGVMNHPYFAVSKPDGSFMIANVPAGQRTIHVWHESFGDLEQTVSVKAGVTTPVTFAFNQASK